MPSTGAFAGKNAAPDSHIVKHTVCLESFDRDLYFPLQSVGRSEGEKEEEEESGGGMRRRE